ncbi:hypothetical protein HPB49_009726 [Dermacentor silvarum]|uniref:Uncharacterized protein n=1 Tax=Dermacentor silvarum TaxID=543639 RepID=A0ACB8CQQ3_DERSI|nr:hypothetical protein HPB49_009726 [Dermacentor silvarum]
MKMTDSKMQHDRDDTDARRNTPTFSLLLQPLPILFRAPHQIKIALNLQASASADELWLAIKREWKRLGERRDFVDALYESIPRRLRAALRVDGAFARY